MRSSNQNGGQITDQQFRATVFFFHKYTHTHTILHLFVDLLEFKCMCSPPCAPVCVYMYVVLWKMYLDFQLVSSRLASPHLVPFHRRLILSLLFAFTGNCKEERSNVTQQILANTIDCNAIYIIYILYANSIEEK